MFRQLSALGRIIAKHKLETLATVLSASLVTAAPIGILLLVNLPWLPLIGFSLIAIGLGTVILRLFAPNTTHFLFRNRKSVQDVFFGLAIMVGGPLVTKAFIGLSPLYLGISLFAVLSVFFLGLGVYLLRLGIGPLFDAVDALDSIAGGNSQSPDLLGIAKPRPSGDTHLAPAVRTASSLSTGDYQYGPLDGGNSVPGAPPPDDAPAFCSTPR